MPPTVSLTVFYATSTCHGYATLIFLKNENVCAFYAYASYFSCVALISSRHQLCQSLCRTTCQSRPRRSNFYCATPTFSSIVISTLTCDCVYFSTLTFDCVYFSTLTFDYVYLLTSIVTCAGSSDLAVAYIPEKATTTDVSCDFLPDTTSLFPTLNDSRSTCRGHVPTAAESRTHNPGRRLGIRFSGSGRRAGSCTVCPSDNSSGRTTLEGQDTGHEVWL